MNIYRKNNKLLLLSFLLIIVSVWNSYHSGFNWIKGSLSDFGLINDFFNLSLIISGLALGIFTLTAIKREDIGWLCRLFLLFSSALLTLIGIFTKQYFVHFIFAVLLFAIFPLGMFILSNHLKNSNYRLGTLTKIVALFLIFLWLAFFFIWFFIFKFGLAIPEIITLVTWIIWTIIFIKDYKPSN